MFAKSCFVLHERNSRCNYVRHIHPFYWDVT
jgi:hypothetical protein